MREGMTDGMMAVIPPLMMLLAILLTLLPINLGENTTPHLEVIILFFWTIYRPLPVWVVLACGVLMDITSGVALGVYPAVYLLTTIVAQQLMTRLKSPSLWHLWGYFILVLVIFVLTLWLMVMLSHQGFVAWHRSQLFALGLTVALFPLFVYPLLSLLRWMHRHGYQLQSS
ncbi:MAG: hypothetical protein AAF442_09770 [Pseudomonadota bacterium]